VTRTRCMQAAAVALSLACGLAYAAGPEPVSSAAEPPKPGSEVAAQPGSDGAAKPGSDVGRGARRGAERLGLDVTSSDQPLEINAGRQTLRERADGGRISSWSGNVVLTQGDLKLSCEKLEISFASEKKGGAVEKIEALGKVDIAQRDVALQCDRAVYEESTCRAVCERTNACTNPGPLAQPALLRQGKDTVRGGRIEFDVCTGDFEVSCGASGLFQPRRPEAKPDAKGEAKPEVKK
jgi:lipopolysaccharide transport protein LptA